MYLCNDDDDDGGGGGDDDDDDDDGDDDDDDSTNKRFLKSIDISDPFLSIQRLPFHPSISFFLCPLFHDDEDHIH